MGCQQYYAHITFLEVSALVYVYIQTECKMSPDKLNGIK